MERSEHTKQNNAEEYRQEMPSKPERFQFQNRNSTCTIGQTITQNTVQWNQNGRHRHTTAQDPTHTALESVTERTGKHGARTELQQV